MAGAMRKTMLWLGLVEDEEDDYRDDPRSARSARAPRGRSDEYDDVDIEEYETGRVDYDDEPGVRRLQPAPERSTRGSLAVQQAPRLASLEDDDAVSYRITTLHPRTYNEARLIGEQFRENVPVIMNLTEMDDTDAKRLVDFAAGLIFGLRGSIERVTSKVFLLTPANVEVTAEDKARIAEGGFFNQS